MLSAQRQRVRTIQSMNNTSHIMSLKALVDGEAVSSAGGALARVYSGELDPKRVSIAWESTAEASEGCSSDLRSPGETD